MGLKKWQRKWTPGGSEQCVPTFSKLKFVVSQKQYVVFFQVELVYKLKHSTSQWNCRHCDKPVEIFLNREDFPGEVKVTISKVQNYIFRPCLFHPSYFDFLYMTMNVSLKHQPVFHPFFSYQPLVPCVGYLPVCVRTQRAYWPPCLPLSALVLATVHLKIIH